MDGQNLLKQLTELMKSSEPNLAPVLSSVNDGSLELPESIVVKDIQTTFMADYISGKGLNTLNGKVSINFKEGFNISFNLPDQPKISLKVDKAVLLNLSKGGLDTINGIKVDLPGPFDPSIKAILIEGNRLAIKGSFPTQYAPLPPEIAKLLE